jgi:Uma2 family endonuclease
MVTERNPDTVRGPDVAFYSYQRIPRGPLPKGYWPASPELVVEILSENDRWADVLQKVAEYLNADVLAVVVIDPVPQRVHVYTADSEPIILNASGLLTLPDVLPEFEVVVRRLFEE